VIAGRTPRAASLVFMLNRVPQTAGGLKVALARLSSVA
jgi:hypothetical protein